MITITFNSTVISTTDYLPRYIRHESYPYREISAVARTRDDGEVIVSERFGAKLIAIRGTIKGSSRAVMEANIDALKSTLSTIESNLDIDFDGATRRYVATCRSFSVNRDYMNMNIVPWDAEFYVPSGEGKDTSITTALNQQALTTTTPASSSFDMTGTKPSKPTITLKGNSWYAGTLGVQFENDDTGEKIAMASEDGGTFASVTSSFKIYCEEKKVTFDDHGTEVEVDFYGVFPVFKIGTNNFTITAGEVYVTGIDVAIGDITVIKDMYLGLDRYAQSFEVPYTSATFYTLILPIKKTGAPAGNVLAKIYTDNGNKPSASQVTNSTFTIAAASITTSLAYITVHSAGFFTLNSGQKYWLVVSGIEMVGNYTSFGMFDRDVYAKGNGSISGDGGSTWTDQPTYDYVFKLLFCGGSGTSGVKATVTYTSKYL